MLQFLKFLHSFQKSGKYSLNLLKRWICRAVGASLINRLLATTLHVHHLYLFLHSFKIKQKWNDEKTNFHRNILSSRHCCRYDTTAHHHIHDDSLNSCDAQRPLVLPHKPNPILKLELRYLYFHIQTISHHTFAIKFTLSKRYYNLHASSSIPLLNITCTTSRSPTTTAIQFDMR